jgi:hypothetical protein
MKICPQCRQTYDDNLNYCLSDGTPLTLDQNAAPTILMQPPYATAGQHQPPTVPQWQASAVQPARSSRTLVWVTAILGLVVVLCGGGVGAMYLLSGDRPLRPANHASPQPSTPDASPSKQQAPDDNDLSIEKYNEIDIGMKRADVERVLGGKGTELSNTSGGGTRYTVVQWQGKNYKSIIITFENDKVTNKAQVGLNGEFDFDFDN